MQMCSVCGIEPVVNSGKCRTHYNEYMARYMLKRYHARRAKAVDQLGGACVDCGSTESLELDHAVAADKSFDIGRLWSVSQVKFDAELAKCVLRCSACHVAKSIREGDWNVVEHGGGKSGKKNCPCAPCKAKKAEWNREYKRKRAAGERVAGP